jgi:hypothetical protein
MIKLNPRITGGETASAYDIYTLPVRRTTHTETKQEGRVYEYYTRGGYT